MTIARLAAAVLLTTFSLFSPALAQETPASVTGKLVVTIRDAESEIPLRHAYARYLAPGPPGPGEAAAREEGSVEVLFSEDPLPADRAERETYVAVRSKEGRFRGLRLRFPGHDLVDASAYCEGCYDRDTDMAPFVESWTWSGSSLLTPLGAKLAVDRKTNVLSGEVAMYRPVETSGEEERENSFSFEVTFTAPIEADADAEMTAVDPAVARTYAAFRAAVASGDPAAIRGTVAAEYAASFDGPGAKDRVAILQSILARFDALDASTKAGRSVVATSWSKVPVAPPPPQPDRPGPSRNVPYAQQLAHLREHRPGGLNVRFVDEGGAWKVFWVLDRYGSNVLAAGYRSPAAHLDAIAERERREADEYFAVEGGKPLPRDGGAAGAAYLAFTRAERAADKRALVKFLRDENLEFYSHPSTTIKPGFTIWKRPGTSAVEVVGGEANAEEATLRVAGTLDGAKVTGRVKMILEAGRWKVDSEVWDDAAR
jgi:hypothetical protein